MRKLLVTGCAGFIGSHLVQSLLTSGDEVVGLDNLDDYYSLATKQRNLSYLLSHPSFKFVEGDIRDENLVFNILGTNNIDCIIHLAARAGVRPSIEDPILYMDVNVKGTTVLLEAAKKHNVRKFIFASSSSVYGNNLKVPFAESDNVDFPISPYAASKKAGELICYTYHQLYKLDVSCLRFFTVYGPRQRPEMAISKFVDKIMRGKEIEVYANGTSSRDYTYVEDIVNGIVLALNKVEGYQICNIGGSSPIKLIDLIKVIENAVGQMAHVKFLPIQPGDVDKTYADISLAESALGYKPKTSIEDGIRKYVDSIRSEHLNVI